MNYITTTQLRTKSSDMVRALESGRGLELIHRSQVIATIKPKAQSKQKNFDPEVFLKHAALLGLDAVSRKERDQRYREYMQDRHGKNIS